MWAQEWDDPERWDEPDHAEEPEPDPAVAPAKPRILQLFGAGTGRLLYQIQIAVILEREFFHWITVRALRELEAEGELIAEFLPLGMEIGLQEVRVKFYRKRSNRNWRREAERMLALIRGYAVGPLARGLGAHGEMMFDAGLGSAGFRVLARDVNGFDGHQWTDTDHNLDRIYERDGVRYGAEIKNTLGYIPRTEFQIKLRICRTLRVRPLFIARSMPKSYINDVFRAGGFSLVFGYQFYPHGYDHVAREVRDVLSLPVDTPARLADGTIARFVGWHDRNLARNIGGYP
jgi:hypothetical protein